jgi:tRNA pseudouridine55 synthase
VTAAGLVIVDKPGGMTSHDVVGRLRRIFGTRRVGHAGTLDPMATGVLVLGVERATKLLGHLALTDKAYHATIRLGITTTTDDSDGEIVTTTDAAAVDEAAVRVGMRRLTGDIQQVPSAVSAIKVDGVRAYARVRAGEDVELAARPVTVTAFDLHELHRAPALDGTGLGVTDLDVGVECSTGTYVRALARDLGAALGVGAHLVALRRTRVGPFGLEGARTLDELADEPTLTLSLQDAVAAAMPRRDIDAPAAEALSHGRRLPAAGIAGVYGAFGPDGRVIALLTERDGEARPVVVLAPAGGP